MNAAERWNIKFRGRFRTKTFPPRIIRDLEKFEPLNVIDALVVKLQDTKGVGLFLHGEAGSGKTVLAAMLLEALKIYTYTHPTPFLEVLKNKEDTKTKYKPWAYFISVCDLLAEIKGTFSTPEQTEMEIIEKYSRVDYLVLDDIGIEKTSDWTFQTLYIIINRRYEYLKPTIFTSNLNLAKLAEQMGDDRIPSRIFGMCYIYNLKNKDRRLEI